VLYDPLVRIAEPLVKWAVEVTRLEDLPRIVRRAAKVAMTPPTGPVFISLPGDILNSEAGLELGRATRIDTRVKPSDESLDALVQRILKAERPVIVVGDEIVKSDALNEAAALAEALGLSRLAQTAPYGAHFLSESPCFMGRCRACSRRSRDSRAARLDDRVRKRPPADVGLQRSRPAARRNADRASRSVDWIWPRIIRPKSR